LDKIDKVKHYIRIKTHNNIALRFWELKWCKKLYMCKTLYICRPQSFNDHDYNPYMTKYI